MYELPVNCCKQIAVTLYGGHLNIKRTTLLAKQNRRLLNEDLRPCTQILKAKYLPKTNIANSNTDLRGICEKKGSVWLLEMGKNPASGLNTHTWLGSCCPLIKGLLSKDHSNKMRERERERMLIFALLHRPLDPNLPDSVQLPGVPTPLAHLILHQLYRLDLDFG